MKHSRRKILYIAGRERTYSRTFNVIKALELAGYEIKTILPPDRSFKNYPGLILNCWKWRKWPDLVVVGFYGQLLMPFVRAFCRKPILFDVYISTFGTMVNDRGKAQAKSLKAFLYWLSDTISMRMADKNVIETEDHIHDYSSRFRIPVEKFRQIFLPVDKNLVHPKNVEKNNGRFLVHFHGEYAPFHGVKYIFQAADILRDEDIDFLIIGTGITYEEDRRLAENLNLKNIRFIDRVPYSELADFMSKADVCLGIFGDNPRTLRVLTNKVVETIACGRPLITAKNGPVQELLKDGESALLINRADPQALADAILSLKNNPDLRKRIADNGHQVYLKNCTIEIFSEKFSGIIEEILND